jgi:glutaminase
MKMECGLGTTQILADKTNDMTHNKLTNQNLLEIAALRFKTIVTEATDSQSVTLELPMESGVQGFIVLVQPALPSIN